MMNTNQCENKLVDDIILMRYSAMGKRMVNLRLAVQGYWNA